MTENMLRIQHIKKYLDKIYYSNTLDRYTNNPAQISNDYLNQPMMKSDSILMLNVQNIKDAKVYTC